ncbi:MAG: hypothetical protein HW420_514 [Candidatus Nitrosotenuis sp.]|nr:hypothetical protein [Candidatus Nitrosotenuis sp.]
MSTVPDSDRSKWEDITSLVFHSNTCHCEKKESIKGQQIRKQRVIGGKSKLLRVHRILVWCK